MTEETKWEKEFQMLEKLVRSELGQLQAKINHSLENLNKGISSDEFLSSLKETIDKATQMNQLYGVLRYTKRWNDGQANTRTSTKTPGHP